MIVLRRDNFLYPRDKKTTFGLTTFVTELFSHLSYPAVDEENGMKDSLNNILFINGLNIYQVMNCAFF
jgi:hypothetical protein